MAARRRRVETAGKDRHKKGDDDEEKEEGDAGKRDSGRQGLEETEGSKKEEEQTHSSGPGQHENQQEEEEDNTTMADIAKATRSMTLAEGKGKDGAELKQLVTISAALVLTEDDLWEVAPDEYKCPLEMCLMTDGPVVASDGFMYSKKGLER